MTAPEAARAAKSYALPLVLGVFALGIAVNFALLIPALHRQGVQAREGQHARTRQQVVFPVSLKVYEDAEHRGVITPADLACFKSSADCPPMRP